MYTNEAREKAIKWVKAFHIGRLTVEEAKQCALIALQFRIQDISEHIYMNGYEYVNPEFRSWSKVKEEMDKL